MLRPYVVVAADFIRTGGMDRANYALARHLARRGHPTHLVSFRVASDLAEEPNVFVHRALRPGGRHTLGGPFLGSLATAEFLGAGRGAELVANGGNCPMPGGVNWVHYVHAADVRTRGRTLGIKSEIAQVTERLAISGARLVFANSDRTRRDLVNYLGVDDAKIRVVYLGVDSTDFRPRTEGERAEMRARLGWKIDRKKAVFVGGLGDERKGFGTLLTAWTSLCRSPDWDVDLVVIGSGRQLDAFRSRAHAAGISDRVEFLGFRSDVPLVVGACDLLVAPSIYEPYGLAVHEALCSGVAAITSRRSGVAEVYPQALDAWLLPDPEDDVDLANRIRNWRSSVPETTALGTLSDKLRARDWDVVARDIVDLCEA